VDAVISLGVLLIVLGVLAVFSPAIAGGAVVSVVGVILIIAGLVQAARAFQAAGAERVLTLILGAIAVLAGIAVVLHPLLGLAFLTLLLAVYFAAEGAWKIAGAFRYRPFALWLAASGLLSLVLAWLIWSQWPVSGLWAVGVLVGVNLLGTGAALVTLAGLSARTPAAR
jgi:uncharacterized membrane protein HdeD (DUF308 family)